jgi:L-ascorbate metabolism protein UlaG (beta-lactamase superfamily)
MNKFTTIPLLLYLLVNVWGPIEVAAQEGVVLKWLGNAGWEIRAGETIILIDPFLTRKEANPGAEWKTDENAVLKVISKADYIFAGHSHADHIGDLLHR